MSDKPEYSPGGSQIFRHEHSTETDDALSHGDTATMAAICAHMEKHAGKIGMVFHEIVSPLVHVDVHTIPPTPDRNYWILFTTGMSERPMTVPPGAEDFRFAELMVCLPPTWQVTDHAFKTDEQRWYWPIRWLKSLARLPHQYSTWLGFGHTIPNGDPAQRITPHAPFTGWIVLPPTSLPSDAWKIEAPGKTIMLYGIHPLYTEEMSLKLNRGSDALIDLFDERGVSDIIDPSRKPVTKKKLFGLF